MSRITLRAVAALSAAALPAFVSHQPRTSLNEESTSLPSSSSTSFIRFIGTGSSTGCPKPICLLSSSALPEHSKLHCKGSRIANEGDPKHNKNYRGNPSILIGYRPSSSSSTPSPSANIVVDVGKTFREHFIRWIPSLPAPYSVPSVDAVVLTHEHMDAYGGLDDLRGVQHFGVTMPVHLSPKTLKVVKGTFPYLFPKPPEPGEVKRHVASVEFNEFAPFKPFDVNGFEITPLPVIHGEDCVCFGFAFGTTEKVLYLSDISRMPEPTLEYIKSWAKETGISVLILDSLLYNRAHNTHFGLDQAAELVKVLKPKSTYLVGMSCDSFPPHDEANKALAEKFPGLNIKLAHDGLLLPLDL